MRVGVSACLVGQAVRYDGADKRNHFVVDELARLVELVPVCPEVEVGMGVPRPPLHLVGPALAPRMVVASTGEDWTARMERFARDRVRRLIEAGISGYVLKARSPSCGLDGVELHHAAGGPTTREGRGLFAAELRRALPDLPIEEEGALEDHHRRQAFLAKVFAYRRPT